MSLSPLFFMQEKARAQVGVYAHLSPFFILAKKSKKNKKEEVCYGEGGDFQKGSKD